MNNARCRPQRLLYAAGSDRSALVPRRPPLRLLKAPNLTGWSLSSALNTQRICPPLCRLTWLGDAVLGAAVSDLLYTGLPPNATTEQLHNSRMVRWLLPWDSLTHVQMLSWQARVTSAAWR